jgi:hypothetical protein
VRAYQHHVCRAPAFAGQSALGFPSADTEKIIHKTGIASKNLAKCMKNIEQFA